jgi:hypothetical protein
MLSTRSTAGTRQRGVVMSTLANVALFGSALVAATPACAQSLTITDDKPAFYQTYSGQIAPPWLSQAPNPRLVEYPLADVIATKLGISEGKVELFRYRLENAPSKATVLYGVMDGGGVRLKLSW